MNPIIYSLITAALPVSIIMIIYILKNKKCNLKAFIIMFFIIFICNLFTSGKLHARTPRSREIRRIQVRHEDLIPISRKTELDEYDQMGFVERIKFHEENAIRTWKDAEKLCWYIPQRSDKEKAFECFKASTGALAPGNLRSRAINVLIIALTNYGIDCIEEWDTMKTKLNWCAYHIDMSNFYRNALKNSQ